MIHGFRRCVKVFLRKQIRSLPEWAKNRVTGRRKSIRTEAFACKADRQIVFPLHMGKVILPDWESGDKIPVNSMTPPQARKGKTMRKNYGFYYFTFPCMI